MAMTDRAQPLTNSPNTWSANVPVLAWFNSWRAWDSGTSAACGGLGACGGLDGTLGNTCLTGSGGEPIEISGYQRHVKGVLMPDNSLEKRAGLTYPTFVTGQKNGAGTFRRQACFGVKLL